MRSYHAARALFSFLAFCAWTVVIIGVLVGVLGAGGGSRYGGAGTGLLAMAPGIGIAISGLILVAFSQMGRANVDTAEYTQQMLKVARNQLEVSKQSLKQGVAFSKSYSSLNKETLQNPGHASKPVNQDNASPSQEEPIPNSGKKVSYNGHVITETSGIFHVRDAEFRQIKHARAYIDLQNEKENLAKQIATLNANQIPKFTPITSAASKETIAKPVVGPAPFTPVANLKRAKQYFEQIGMRSENDDD